jgi:hypothetical protein
MFGLMAAVADRFTRRPWNRTEKQKIIQAALEFPLDHVVARYRQEEEVSEAFARDVERELRRYLILCALYPRRSIPMHGPVDQLWHTFLTFTHDYAEFCRQVAGRFIHHRPDLSGAAGWRGLKQFVRLYHQTFGQLPSEDVWPAAAGVRPARNRQDASGSNWIGGGSNGCNGGGCSGGCGGGGD